MCHQLAVMSCWDTFSLRFVINVLVDYSTYSRIVNLMNIQMYVNATFDIVCKISIFFDHRVNLH